MENGKGKREELVDPQAVQGFLRNALAEVDPDEMAAVADALIEKSAEFGRLLGSEDAVEALDEPAIRGLLGRIFAVRRQRDSLLAGDGGTKFRAAVRELLHKPGGVGQHINTFCERLDAVEPAVPWWEVATELLHFAFPHDYWLWARWMWHPGAGTGALPFLLAGDYDLNGNGPGELYLKVGRNVAMTRNYAELVNFAGPELRDDPKRALFIPDIFLAAVYAVYLYSVTSWKLSREFNKVLPTLPQLVRRLLGVPIST